jgi:hypothetical protein
MSVSLIIVQLFDHLLNVVICRWSLIVLMSILKKTCTGDQNQDKIRYVLGWLAILELPKYVYDIFALTTFNLGARHAEGDCGRATAKWSRF